MKYCVIASCSFDKTVQRDQMVKAVSSVTATPVWGETSTSIFIDEAGKPSYGLVKRYDKKEDMDKLFALIKKQMDLIPALKGSTVSKHPCPHDEGGSCIPREEYVK